MSQDPSAQPTPAANGASLLDFPIVGVGASAGGLDAIKRLFDSTPSNTGMAYVIVQHLSPDFESLMDQLLSRHTAMQIHRVEDGMLVKPNRIYLIPPKKNMALSQGRLLLTDQQGGGQINLPIDIFFRSLAQDAGPRAVAIILSGTGADGTRGVQQVHDSGGLVLAQDLESAGFDGMPRSAAATGVVDVVCPPEKMPEKIAEYLQDPAHFQRGQFTMPMTAPISRVVQGRSPFVVTSPVGDTGHTLEGAYNELLSKYAPPSLLVNERFELIHSFGDARSLLVQPEGRPTLDVLKLVGGDLRMALGAALHKASQQRTTVVYRGVRVRDGEQDRQFKVVVEPYVKGDVRMFLICLESVEALQTPETPAHEFDAREQSSERITVLEQELASTRESLQSTVEELETSNEELQSTNEELITSNEELQSTNEQLHSVNEELDTVNSEHKEKIDELTQLTSDMDNLLKSTEIGAVFLDRELRIRMFTPAISSAFGVLEQDIGRPIDHIAYKLDYPNLMGDIRSVLASGSAIETEVRSEAGGTFLQRVRPYRAARGRIDGVTITFTDVSAVKEVEEAREHNAELARTNRDLQDFAYAVSHDLSAPLRHIKDGCRELALGLEGQLDGENLTFLKQVGDSATKLSQMVQGLLTYSRISTRGKPLEEVDCNQVFLAAQDALLPALQEASGELECGRLPTIHGDNNQLGRLFYELLDNAIKYRDERPLRVSIDAERRNGRWLFKVADNGVGIEPRHFERVFIVFQRLGFKSEVPGEGLGLALCKRIVERHNGRIWVESTPGEGAAFRFTLPA